GSILGRWWRYKWITFHPSLTAGENLVGKGNATFDVNRIINFYVADASY
ncbi:hypothetical protein YPPY101_3502, partial [Yersinia pestis PY-101]